MMLSWHVPSLSFSKVFLIYMYLSINPGALHEYSPLKIILYSIIFCNDKSGIYFEAFLGIKYRAFQAKIRGVKESLGVESGRGVIDMWDYQPFLEKTAGIVRINIYRFSSSDLFCM